MLRSWVLQFESTPQDPLPAPPASALASWGTHDLARFWSYFWGTDIDENEGDGRLPHAEATAQRQEREHWRTAILDATGTAEDVADPALAALHGCLSHLAQGAADLVLVDLEELWGERQPQNRPGTGTEASNWRRRASHTLEEARDDIETAGFLRHLNALRHPDAVTDQAAARP
jgi:4-alpha-glucanotransferase